VLFGLHVVPSMFVILKLTEAKRKDLGVPCDSPRALRRNNRTLGSLPC